MPPFRLRSFRRAAAARTATARCVQTLRWALRPLAFMEECRRRYGDSFSVKFLGFERRW